MSCAHRSLGSAVDKRYWLGAAPSLNCFFKNVIPAFLFDKGHVIGRDELEIHSDQTLLLRIE